jgi:hypothetical protein
MASDQTLLLPVRVTRADQTTPRALEDLERLIYDYSIEAERGHLHSTSESRTTARHWLKREIVLLAHRGTTPVGAMILRREPLRLSGARPALESLHTFAPVAYASADKKSAAHLLVEAARDLAWADGVDLRVYFQRDRLTPRDERAGRLWLARMGGEPCSKMLLYAPIEKSPVVVGLSYVWRCPTRERRSA